MKIQIGYVLLGLAMTVALVGYHFNDTEICTADACFSNSIIAVL